MTLQTTSGYKPQAIPNISQCILSFINFNWLSLIYLRLAKDVPVVTEEVKEQLVEASAVTKKAFTTYKREMEAEEHQAAAEGTPVPAADKGQEEGEMSVIITIMQPILRLLQLLCENHNRDLQVSHWSALPLAFTHICLCGMWTFLFYASSAGYKELKPFKKKKKGTTLQNALMQFLYLVRLGLVSFWAMCCCLEMAKPKKKCCLLD